MVSIDLDPASCLEAQTIVKAERYFTADCDGLTQVWRGNVFLNPPFSFPEIEYFTSKLVRSYLNGRVKQAIVLTNNCTDAAWFHTMAKNASAICFTLNRIQFYSSSHIGQRARQGQVFCYFGENVDDFIREFELFGLIVINAGD